MNATLLRSDDAGHAEFCQSCGALAPTKYVSFYRIAGAIVLVFLKSIKGNFCRSCINDYFWHYSLFTLLFGWSSVFSFFVTPFVLLNNIVRYISTLGMGNVPDPMFGKLTWLKGMPLSLRPDAARARELETLRTQNNILHSRFLPLVMQSPGTTKTSIEQEYEQLKMKLPSATNRQIYEAIIQDRYMITGFSGGMELGAARALNQEPWVRAKVSSVAGRIETIDELTRYIVEEYEDFWNRTPDPFRVNTRIAEILGYYRQYPSPQPRDAETG